MFFPQSTPLTTINQYINAQINAVDKSNGIDIIITPHVKTRTIPQNKYLHAVFAHIVHFYHDTGFIPPGLSRWAMKPDIVKEYFKDYFAITKTSKLTTKEITDFIDKIQLFMIENSHGEYQPITPDDPYVQSLLN